MKLKDKIKSYSFWVSLASALILILKVLGSRFGFTIDESMVSDIFTAICSILVLLGIIVIPQAPNTTETENTNSNEIEESIKQSETENLNSSEKESVNFNENFNKTTEASDEISEQDTNNLENQIDNNINIGNNISNFQDIEMNLIDNSNNDELRNNLEGIENDKERFVVIENNNSETYNEINNDDILPEINIGQETEISIETKIENKNITALKEILSNQRSKFSDNLEDYVIELENEINKLKNNL